MSRPGLLRQLLACKTIRSRHPGSSHVLSRRLTHGYDDVCRRAVAGRLASVNFHRFNHDDRIYAARRIPVDAVIENSPGKRQSQFREWSIPTKISFVTISVNKMMWKCLLYYSHSIQPINKYTFMDGLKDDFILYQLQALIDDLKLPEDFTAQHLVKLVAATPNPTRPELFQLSALSLENDVKIPEPSINEVFEVLELYKTKPDSTDGIDVLRKTFPTATDFENVINLTTGLKDKPERSNPILTQQYEDVVEQWRKEFIEEHPFAICWGDALERLVIREEINQDLEIPVAKKKSKKKKEPKQLIPRLDSISKSLWLAYKKTKRRKK